jgi:putative aldouronate transport system substrate-binding protein
MPVFVPFTGANPDIPSGADGVPAGYFHYPASPSRFHTGPIGNGGKVDVMISGVAVGVARDKNPRWQALEKSANVKFNFSVASASDYTAKFQVGIASGKIPDLTQVIPVQQMLPVLESLFVDLTPYLGGDGVKQYPGLASLPSSAWTISSLNGKVWGIPQPRPAAGSIASYRGDVFEKRGVVGTPSVGDGDDFKQLCKDLSNGAKNEYAIGAQPNSWVLNAILEMMEAPNGWRESGGKFTSVYESDEMKDALTETKWLWDNKCIHPDSFVTPGDNGTWWVGGTTAIFFQNIAGWAGASLHPERKISVIPLPKWGGGGMAKKALGLPGYPYYVGLSRTADEKRIQELLRVCDYLAAPFGTQDFLDIWYGVKGHNYTMDGSDPVAVTETSAEALPIGYIGSQAYVNLYSAGDKDLVTAEHDYIADVMPSGVGDASWGLYSETKLGAGVAAKKVLSNLQGDIIQGRRSVSEWDAAVAAWRKAAGDQIRKEYEAAWEGSQ